MAFHRIIPSLSNTSRYIGVLACVTLLLIVVVECILNALRTGTSCCFDDAAHAVVSKNLAKGNSYLLSFDFDDLDRRGNLFDPQLGTGPSTILVGALAIWMFGVKPAVPALSLILINALVFAAWIHLLARACGRTRALLYAALFLLSGMALTAKHHEEWFAFLGELEAFLFSVTAFALVSFGRQRGRTFFLAGILFGLSFLAKELSALYAFAFGLASVGSFFERRDDHSDAKDLFRKQCLAASGALAPILLFESYRLCALGIHGLIHNWRQHLHYSYLQGFGAESVGAALITARDRILQEHYSVSLVPLAVIMIGLTALTRRYCGDRRIHTYSLFLLATLAVHLGYWFVISIGWPRYAFNAILFACAIVPIVILGARASTARRATVLTIVFTILVGLPGLIHYTVIWFTPAWAHMASLEYLGNQPGQFSSITGHLNAPGLLVVNRRLGPLNNLQYAVLSARCHRVRTFEPDYEIYACIGAESRNADGPRVTTTGETSGVFQ